MKTSRNLDKFLLLMWKNFLLKLRHPLSSILEILLPILFCLILCLITSRIQSEHHDQISYKAFSLDTVKTLTGILWSPCENPTLIKIMMNISMKLQIGHKCFNDSSSLQNALQYYAEVGVVGVQFEDSLARQIGLHKNIKVSLRFPEDQRVNFSSWQTNHLMPVHQVAGPREPAEEDGGTPNYYQKGFLSLQNDISRAIISNSTQEKYPEIQMRRFPYPAWTSYPIHIFVDIISFLILFSISHLFTNTVSTVAIEKETQIKEIMKIMGSTNWLHWTAWFVSTLSLSLIPITVVVLMLKVQILPNSTSAVFPQTNSLVLLLFFIFFLCATIACALAVTVFFSSSYTATMVGGIFFILSFFPYFLTKSSSVLAKTSACILCSTAFGHGIQIIGTYESLFERIEFDNLFAPVSSEDSISLGIVMIMLIVDTILYLLITLYVEAIFPGEYGIPSDWYFPCTKSFWCRQSQNVEFDVPDKKLIREANIYEEEPTDVPVGMRILRLKKKFGKNKIVVRNVSFNMFEGEITALLGHNGAGKTTVMSILTGILPPTSGTAIINGYNIRTDMNKIRESLGFCPQQNVLFDSLTVSEHLYFFSILKGMGKKAAKEEAQKYIQMLDLTAKQNAKAKILSGGMKRRLCVAIALCGESKICIFDEPTSGMDPTGRRKLWDVMQAKKKGRTILLSTHFMDEADVLGDRIAIITNGALQCYGSSFFLKKKYGTGYRLIIVKSKGCDITRINKLLNNYIPEITVEADAGSEVTYVLPEEKSSKFEAMLTDLERNARDFKIDSYGISLATMEEVFMKVGLDGDQDDDEQDFKKTEPYLAKSDLNVQQKNYYLRGLALYTNQLLAMVIKKGITSYRTWFILLIHFVVPVGITIMNMYFLHHQKAVTIPFKLDFTLESYDDPIAVITTENVNNIYYDEYKKLLKAENGEYIDWGNEKMDDRLIIRTAEDTVQVRNHYIMGASFYQSNSTITAWFSNEYFHSAPLALQYVINSVVKKNLGSDHSIEFSNDPAPRTVNTTDESKADAVSRMFYAFTIGQCMTFVTPYFAIFCVRERICKSKHLQLVSGTAVSAFWLIAFAWDYTIYILISICIVIVLICFEAVLDINATLVILAIFGFVMLPMVYLASLVFPKPSSAYSGIMFICTFLGVMAFIIISVVLGMVDKNIQKNVHNVFLIMPLYTLTSGIYNISNTYSLIEKCDMINKLHQNLHQNASEVSNATSENIACQLVPDICCDTTYYSSEYGIGRHIRYLMFVGAISFIMLFLIEFRICDCLCYALIAKTPSNREEEEEDNDVLEEKRKVQMGEIKQSEYKVVLKNMSKYYRRLLAVNQLCLGVKECECFGLLGVNGAGKTTSFKMLTGEVKLSYGNAWICGLNIRTNIRKIRKYVGYCPQFDALLEYITGRETLLMYCLLRGIRMKDCKRISEQLAREFQFFKHLDKKVKNYSGGNRRKLSTAIALIGEPPVLFLDEPSTGMDPATKRYLWNTLCKIRDNGKCVILVTHNMEECEAICTRVAIMVNGVFKCLGSPQHLKNKFADGYILIIKIRKSTKVLPVRDYLAEVDQFVQRSFSKAELKDSHETLVTYIIKDVALPWSKIFGIMEKAKKGMAVIEDYSVSQFDLEQIFLHFTKFQEFGSG